MFPNCNIYVQNVISASQFNSKCKAIYEQLHGVLANITKYMYVENCVQFIHQTVCKYVKKCVR